MQEVSAPVASREPAAGDCPLVENQICVLVADDDAVIRKLTQRRLQLAGMKVITACDGVEALSNLDERVQVALLDLRMPGLGGIDCLRKMAKSHPLVESVIITASSEVGDAVQAMKNGAFDYLTKPLNLDELVQLVRRAAATFQLKQENRQLRAAIGAPSASPISFIGTSRASLEVVNAIQKVSHLGSSVLISGESGVGKGLVARIIHNAGPRNANPFVTVSCTALPRDLVEAELFGHEKGAFTGAVERRPGRLEMAHDGTLFLDEIGDMPLDLQPKLLNFLQDRSFQRIGCGRTIDVDVRVIAATHQDLREMCGEKRFREDLYFRLNVLPIRIPPLRERKEDIPLLAQHLLDRLSARRGACAFSLESSAIEALMEYSWPGNVRELENILERTTAFSDCDVIQTSDLPTEVTGGRSPSSQSNQLAGLALSEVERLAISQTLQLCCGNKSKTARVLGISEKSVYNKIKRLGIASAGIQVR